MPEYLAPGVYIEETSFRNKTIEGVSTSTAGFVGPTRFGPPDGVPELLTSLADFERIYGSIDPLVFDDGTETPNFLAQGVRAFFDNGGKRLYVARTHATNRVADANDPFGTPPGHAVADLFGGGSLPAPGQARLIARYPGRGGNVEVTFTFRRGQNALVPDPGAPTDPARRSLRGVQQYDLVVVNSTGADPFGGMGIFRARRRLGEAEWGFYDDATDVDAAVSTPALRQSSAAVTDVRVVTMSVEVRFEPPVPRAGATRTEVWENLSFDLRHERTWNRWFGETLTSRTLTLTVPFYVVTERGGTAPGELGPVAFLRLLTDRTLDPEPGGLYRFAVTLRGGTDGNRPAAADYEGQDADPRRKTGLKAFEDLADISIVAAPGSSYNSDRAHAVALELIEHCERMRYRIAVLDSRNEQGLTEVRAYRAQFDSKHAALYYPWVTVIDPVTNDERDLPPSGFVAGIYARNDIEHGVHKAPANEVVRDAVNFEVVLNKSQQDALNPEGVNCFRYFEGRGLRLWGARLATSDPEWKYVNLRRYFAYLERSIERGTQWVVFENNSETLWANVRSTVEDFLFNEWKSGHLMGMKPDEAYFVRCDRSTMTQNDIDNGRLICLIGVAPVRPAEFVIFRIGQWTATARQ
jgi:uncharacterized protein